jgi:hypothetical protein
MSETVFTIFSFTRAGLIEDRSWNIILLPLFSLLPFFLGREKREKGERKKGRSCF